MGVACCTRITCVLRCALGIAVQGLLAHGIPFAAGAEQAHPSRHLQLPQSRCSHRHPILQVAGLRYAFDPAGPDNASRLVAAQLLAGVDGQGVPLASYQGDVLLLTTDYVAGGGDL